MSINHVNHRYKTLGRTSNSRIPLSMSCVICDAPSASICGRKVALLLICIMSFITYSVLKFSSICILWYACVAKIHGKNVLDFLGRLSKYNRNFNCGIAHKIVNICNIFTLLQGRQELKERLPHVVLPNQVDWFHTISRDRVYLAHSLRVAWSGRYNFYKDKVQSVPVRKRLKCKQ